MTLNGENLRNIIIQNVSFKGATGLIEIFGGMPKFSKKLQLNRYG